MSTEMNRLRCGRRWTVPRALSVLLMASLALLGLLVTLLVLLRVVSLLEAQTQIHEEEQARAAAADLSAEFAVYLDVLRDHAGFPILVDTLIHPEGDLSGVSELMDALRFLGEPAQEALLSARGMTLSASRRNVRPDLTSAPWLQPLLDGERDSYQGIVQAEGRQLWRMAVLVRDKDFARGVLVADIPFDSLCKRLHPKIHSEGLRMDLLYQGRMICRLGVDVPGTRLSLPGPVPEMSLNVQFDERWAMQARHRILMEIAGLVTLMVFMIGWLSIRLARRWFMEPIHALQRVAANLDAGRQCEAPAERQRLQELDDLFHGFARMARRIRECEHSLIENRDQLAESNERLLTSQKQLIQSEKMASLGALAAGVAHEINNPIGFIQSNLATLKDYHAVLLPLIEDFRALVQAQAEQEPDLLCQWEARLQGEDLDFLLEDLESLVADTTEGAQRVAAIVAGLRTFAHRGDRPDEPLNLNDCVTAALRLANNELKYKAEVELRLGELPCIRGSSGQITQVLVNLLVNAAQAIEERGWVGIETWVEGDSVVVRVSDSGGGIAPEHLDQLFTPFFTTKKVGIGTGLGLSISHGIITSCGGTMRVESELGRGTQFTLELPLDRPETTAAIRRDS